MYCSGCGQPIVPGQPVCTRCGRPIVAAPPIPGLMLELDNYAGKVKALSIVWFIYGALALLVGLMGLAFTDAMMSGRFGPWMHGPFGPHGFPFFLGPPFMHLMWAFVLCRAGLALAAGWGLLHRTPWGRIVAIVAAFFSILKIPFGTALAIWTLVVLMGYRNSTLYDQLPEC